MALSLQLGLNAMTSTALYVDLVMSAAQECICAHGDGQMCPMHHAISPSRHKQACAFRSAANPHAEAVATLLGPIAVLASAPEIDHPTRSASVTLPVSRQCEAFSLPDSPPPRS
jgi:hypothetical protein